MQSRSKSTPKPAQSYSASQTRDLTKSPLFEIAIRFSKQGQRFINTRTDIVEVLTGPRIAAEPLNEVGIERNGHGLSIPPYGHSQRR